MGAAAPLLSSTPPGVQGGRRAPANPPELSRNALHELDATRKPDAGGKCVYL